MISTLHSIILGIVEGLTEFLPISSTAHLILANNILGGIQDNFTKSFEIIIQLGAILAVIVMFWRSFIHVDTLKRLIVAFIPTGIIGLALYKVVKTYLLNSTGLILWSLAIGGLILILFEIFHRPLESMEESENLSYKKCLWIGLAQAVAIIPGVSRSGATIVGGMLLGLRREVIVKFSFLLAVPTMLAATGLDFVKNYKLFSADQFSVLTFGFITSFIMALIAIKFFLAYIRKHSFTAFGVYRVLLVLAYLWVTYSFLI